MTQINLEAITSQFPPTIAEEVALRHADVNLKSAPEERIKLFGLRALLGSEPHRDLRTKKIAEELGVSEPTLFRIVGNPFVEAMLESSLDTLKNKFYAPRYDALRDLAIDLAIDESVDFQTAVKTWSAAYGAIANPGSLFNLNVSTLQDKKPLIAAHAGMISRNVQLLGVRSGTEVAKTLGGRILPTLAAYDMTEDLDVLGQVTEDSILANLDRAA